MSRLILIRGNSASGKTTIAKRLQLELGYRTMLVPQDVIRREIIRTKDTANNPSIRLIEDIANYGRSIGYDVILEGILTNKFYREMLDRLMSQFKDGAYTYYFDISFDETVRRHATKSNAHEYGADKMREWYVEKDMLGLVNEVILTDAQSEEEIFQRILRDLKHFSVIQK